MFDFLKKLFSSTSDNNLTELIKQVLFLVDVRTPGEFSAGNVKGSVNIPLDQVGKQIAKFKNKSHVIVFCRSGMRSSQAISILKQNGINNVTNGKTWNNVKQYVN